MHLNEIGGESLTTSAEKGFGIIKPANWEQVEGDARYIIPGKLVLVHSEVSEAVEEFRKAHRLANFGSELADIIIRVGQLGVGLGIDLDAAVLEKLRANKEREFQHGGRLI